jgi:putative selenium metabolism hydrolase
MSVNPETRSVALCQELVRLESPSGREESVAGAVEREMRALGYDEVQRDELGNVVGVVAGARPGGRLLMDAHMDVVPATEPERWRFAPFSGERAEGRIWGRGTTDIKGSLAALIVAVGTLPRADLAGSIAVSASVGEELIEGFAVARVLERWPAGAVVVCEPTGLRVGLGHRGRASLVIEAEGKAAHTSRPENGINAVYRLVEALARVRALPGRLDALLDPGHSELVEISSRPYPGSSMVPYHATARFDRRLVRGETRDSVLGEVRGALAGLDGVSAHLHQGELACYTGRSIRVEAFHPGWAMEAGSEFAGRARRALEGAGLASDAFYAPYCTNGATTAGELGLPTLLYGAGDIGVAHAVDEAVRVDELVAATRGYQALARALVPAVA